MDYTIGEVSAKFNIPISTLRYYDKQGLLPFVNRNEHDERVFAEENLGFIEVINCMKRIGLSVARIKEFMDLCMAGDSTLNARLDYITEQESFIHKQMADLQTQLKFIEWKKHYYTQAVASGTEKNLFGTHMPAEREKYLA